MTKEEFDKKYVGRKIAVSCKTYRAAKELNALAGKHGHFLYLAQWEVYTNNTVYFIGDGYSDIEYAKNNGCKIIEFKGETKMKARKGLLLEIMEKEFGLKEGDSFNIMGFKHNPCNIVNYGAFGKNIFDTNGLSILYALSDILREVFLGEKTIEKVKDTVTILNKNTGKEVEISLKSAEEIFKNA